MKVNLFLGFLGLSLIAQAQPKITVSSLGGFYYQYHVDHSACIVEYIFTGSKAASSGLKLQDTIIAVGGKTLAGLQDEAVFALFRAGSPGPLNLTIRSGNSRKDIRVNRTDIAIWESFRQEMDTILNSVPGNFENFRRNAADDDLIDAPLVTSYGKSGYISSFHDVFSGETRYDYVIRFGEFKTQEELRKKQLELLNNLEIIFGEEIITGTEESQGLARDIVTLSGIERGSYIQEPFIKLYCYASAQSYSLMMSVAGGKAKPWYLLKEVEASKINASLVSAIQDIARASKKDFTGIMGTQGSENLNFFEERMYYMSTIQVPGFDTRMYPLNTSGNYHPSVVAGTFTSDVEKAVALFDQLYYNSQQALASGGKFYGRYAIYRESTQHYEYQVKYVSQPDVLPAEPVLILRMYPEKNSDGGSGYRVEMVVYGEK